MSDCIDILTADIYVLRMLRLGFISLDLEKNVISNILNVSILNIFSAICIEHKTRF